MLESLADPILPIFAVMVVGFILCRTKLFDEATAKSVNKFVFFIATPALIFSIVSNIPFGQLDLQALGMYLCAQVIIYAVTTILVYRLLSREIEEALLLGMTAIFVNHVFFVLPIAERVYGATAAQPVAGIILVDVIWFCGTVLAIELLQTKSTSLLKVFGLLASNPFLIAASLGVLSWIDRSAITQGIFTYANFVGAAAAPAALFALGIVLASNSLRPVGMATWTVVSLKLVVHPALIIGLTSIVAISSIWKDTVLLVAAGPCGAMPFVIALKYGVKTDTIAKAILFSTLFSLFTLSILSA